MRERRKEPREGSEIEPETVDLQAVRAPLLNCFEELHMYYIYVLFIRSDPSDTYLGYTANFERRVHDHNAGRNMLTQGREWQMVYYEAYINEQTAPNREQKLKHDGRVKRYLMDRIRSQFGAI